MKLLQLFLPALFTLAPSGASAEPLALVVSEQVSLETLGLAELQQLFLGGKLEAGGKRLLALNLPPGSEARERFDREILGMSPEEVPRFWVDQRIRGKGKPPKIIPSAATLVRLVIKLPGAIGYVPLSAVTPGARVVAVDRALPDSSSYVLR